MDDLRCLLAVSAQTMMLMLIMMLMLLMKMIMKKKKMVVMMMMMMMMKKKKELSGHERPEFRRINAVTLSFLLQDNIQC